ncbi:lamin tail domain-containing protein [Halosimplex halobium]|uniref:lamin tail domain-containing protein n=1 Tax=Halosimplex halobium TaxID=3396618 RepID=UPI003F562ACF
MSESTGNQGNRLTWVIYALGILLLLLAINAASDGFVGVIAAIIWGVTGLIVIPPTRSIVGMLSERAGGPDVSAFGTLTLAAIVLVGITAGGVLAPTDNIDSQSPSDDGSISSPTPSPTPTPTPAGATGPSPTATATTTPTVTATPTATTTPTPSGPQTSWTVTVTEVVDGDTMDVEMPDGSTETIRLLGVDTPETFGDVSPDEWEGIPDSYDGRDWLSNWGDNATEYAQERLAGQEIYIEVDSESDRRGSFDRLLVYAYLSESASKSFNLRLIENGYARLYDSQFSQRTVYESAETEARNGNVGVWAYTSPTPIPDGGSDELVVSNVHADAEGNDHENLNDEYIELTNNRDSGIDMTGWTLSDSADHTYSFPDGFTLDSGDSVTIYTGSGSDSSSKLYWGRDSAVWNNGGDTVIVTNDNGERVVEDEYSG